MHDFYGDDPAASPDYGRIVNERHFDRLTGLLDAGGFDAVVTGGNGDRATRYLAPTVLAGVAARRRGDGRGDLRADPPGDRGGRRRRAPIDFVNDRDKPLALYVFTGDDALAERVLERTRSGGVGVNNAMLHLAVPELPFGGVGASGIGAYHGRTGFETFSHRRSVLSKPTKPDPSLLYPPYKSWKETILRRVL